MTLSECILSVVLVFFVLNLYVLFSRLHHSSIPLVPHILFGDFNFRLDNKRVVEVNYETFVLFVTGNTVLKHLSLCIVLSSYLFGHCNILVTHTKV